MGSESPEYSGDYTVTTFAGERKDLAGRSVHQAGKVLLQNLSRPMITGFYRGRFDFQAISGFRHGHFLNSIQNEHQSIDLREGINGRFQQPAQFPPRSTLLRTGKA